MMAYQTGSATDLEDLIGDLSTFLQGATAAWTEDEYDTTNNWATLHKSNVYVSFRWDDSPGTDLGVYQSLGWTDTKAPHEQDDDSGNGDTSTPINAERRCNMLGAGPFTSYFFFASDSAPWYCHVVVEPASGRYRHFGFGELIKKGDWTGGEYCYAHLWDQSGAQVDLATSASHAMGLDDVTSSSVNGATIHAEGLPIQAGTDKWLVVTNSASYGTDSGGNDRFGATGSTRSGLYAYYTSWIATSQLNAYKPMAPVLCMFRDLTTAPDTIWYLGAQPDVAVVNIKNLSPEDEITIGSDTWKVFPWVRKQFDQDGVNEESWNAGIAYKKIV
jgi:hypothetical protein